MNPATPPMTEHTLAAIDHLADAAVSAVTQQIYQRHPALLQRFGKAGQDNCREDLHYHLSYFQAALHGNNTDLFCDYVLWLAGVLDSRSVPVGHLSESLLLMQQYFRAHLPQAEADTITAVWQSGIDALANETDFVR